MQADSLQVVVRPRGILECLDLAVLFCGRRPLAVALATALGGIPCILLNNLAYAATMDDGDNAYPMLVLLSVETAWAAVPLTLYLGQSVFSNHFSRHTATRAFLGGLPALIVFQGILRSICVATFVGAPLIITLYYLDQIILLERPSLSRVWRRRRAVNDGRGWSLLRLAIIDGLLLSVGTCLGTGFLTAFARLWNGEGVAWGAAAIDGDLIPALFSWHGQIAFFAVCGFVTVFRFFTYLDTRIRREGWDIELKLRAEETYAGLPRPSSGRSLLTTATLLAIICGMATAAAAAEPRDAGDARAALSRQAFPWYDIDTDRYRPLLPADRDTDGHAPMADGRDRPPRPRSTRSRQGNGVAGGSNGAGDGTGDGAGDDTPGGRGRLHRDVREIPKAAAPPWSGNFGAILMTVILVAVVAALVYLVVRNGLGDGRREEPPPAELDVLVDESEPVLLPAGIRLADGDPLARATVAAEQGDFATAALLFHAWMLVELDRRGGLVLARGKTNGQYRAEVASAAPAVSSLFNASCRLFEDAFFGRLSIDRGAFLAIWAERFHIGQFAAATSPSARLAP